MFKGCPRALNDNDFVLWWIHFNTLGLAWRTCWPLLCIRWHVTPQLQLQALTKFIPSNCLAKNHNYFSIKEMNFHALHHAMGNLPHGSKVIWWKWKASSNQCYISTSIDLESALVAQHLVKGNKGLERGVTDSNAIPSMSTLMVMKYDVRMHDIHEMLSSRNKMAKNYPLITCLKSQSLPSLHCDWKFRRSPMWWLHIWISEFAFISALVYNIALYEI